MGCVSSKLYKSDFNRESLFSNGDHTTSHVVSLTSSTYGFLKLEAEPFKESDLPPHRRVEIDLPKPEKIKKNVLYEPEIINAWELMGDLEDEMCISKSPKSLVSHHSKTTNSPKKQRRFTGKENKNKQSLAGFENKAGRFDVLKPFTTIENFQNLPTLKLPVDLKIDSFRSDNAFSTPKQSFSPLFDPELLTSFEIELDQEREQIKNMVSPETRLIKPQESELILELFEKKCPPGGENEVIIYTTTLRGIRKTFEDCNTVRSVIQSHDVRIIERDISMDSGFKEELRRLVGKKEIKLPVVFVKGRLIGGVEQVVKMEEQGQLGVLFEGIPRGQFVCERCLGIRFLMCVDCSGSCRVRDDDENKMVKCENCNENGLVQCPFCC